MNLMSAAVLILAAASSSCAQEEVPAPLPSEGFAADFDRKWFSHDLWDGVLKEAVRDGLVDYREIRDDRRFREYLYRLSASRPEDLADESARLAYWINAYNAVTVQGILNQVRLDDPKFVSEWRTDHDSGRFFKGFSYSVGGRRLTLDALEHRVLRVEFHEPRIHFAIVCASMGCPPLRSEAYRSETLEAALEDQARTFLGDSRKNRFDAATGTVILSKIFDWFSDDFDRWGGGRLAFVRKRMPSIPDRFEPRISFSDYDWRLNIQPRGDEVR